MLAGLLCAGLLLIVFLGRIVMSDFDALSIAQNDDVSWRMSQLEVELLHTQNAAQQAALAPQENLPAFRRRFDIFYSRVETLTQSRLLLTLRDTPEAVATLESISTYLDEAVLLIDGPDDALVAALPALQARLQELGPQVRQIALAGLQGFAQESDARRRNISVTMIMLAVTAFALILVLMAAFVVLLRLYRRGQRFAHERLAVQSRFEAAIKSVLDAVLVVDTEGRVIEFNGAAETVFGYSRDEAIGADMAELIVPDHLRDMHRAGMKRYLDTGKPRVMGAGRLRLEGMRKSGEVFPVELSISLSETAGERVFVSFLRDITLELEAEKQLRNARDKAEESEQAKSKLLTVMSHEMRTPLNGILGSLSLIGRDGLSERQKRHLESIAVSGELLLSHVNDVLDFSSLTVDGRSQPRTQFDLADLVHRVATSLQANAEARGNRLEVRFLTGDPGFVQGYRTALQQCLVNLVGNAIKFTSNGVVSVEVERLPSDDLIEMRVSDTGVGIAPENLERIFEEFVTIDTAFSRENTGTGLGLAITRRLAEAMGANIEADSILGEGSIFTMRIPLPPAQPPAHPAPAGQDTGVAEMPSGRRALVADDNRINRMILVDMLSDLGLNVEEAADGLAALEALKTRHFDIVLLDISMPGIDGIETLARIRQLDVGWHDVPAIAITAHAYEQDHQTILRSDFCDLLVKPIDPSSLREAIANALASPAETPPAASAKAAMPDFERRFGHAAYLAALDELASELEQLLEQVGSSVVLSADHRRLAHRLSGSAAILERQALWRALQDLQHPDAGTAAEAMKQAIVDLRAEGERIAADVLAARQ